jgi:hypothetical protein
VKFARDEGLQGGGGRGRHHIPSRTQCSTETSDRNHAVVPTNDSSGSNPDSAAGAGSKVWGAGNFADTLKQGLTLSHFSAQRKRFLRDRGCTQGLFEGF